jgi:signal peptidase I
MFVEGTSMLPSLRPGQLVLVNRWAYSDWQTMSPRRGDLVVFHHQAPGYSDYLIKRVIGVAGDLVQIQAGQVVLNGQRLDEPYVLATDDYTYPTSGEGIRVPQDAYFVLGDNRPVSADSHLGWMVSANDLVGGALMLPLSVPLSVPV